MLSKSPNVPYSSGSNLLVTVSVKIKPKETLTNPEMKAIKPEYVTLILLNYSTTIIYNKIRIINFQTSQILINNHGFQ